MEHVDVLIVGAGLSGIGAAHHLQDRLPGKSYAIFEAREAIGGTWDLFRYPGVRSDSDMQTLGYRFRVSAIPTMTLFRNGFEVARQAGAMPAPQIRKFIEQAQVNGKGNKSN